VSPIGSWYSRGPDTFQRKVRKKSATAAMDNEIGKVKVKERNGDRSLTRYPSSRWLRVLSATALADELGCSRKKILRILGRNVA
jgi:hypothetical protein